MTAPRTIRRLFIANRGEIAVRIIRACRTLGIEVVAGVSEADRGTLAAKLADRPVCIGPPQASKSYLCKEALVAAAIGTGCDAIHPGYGFLAERADFQSLCTDHGLTFIGPSAEVLDAMGNKLRARRIAESLDVPTIPGSYRVESLDQALAFGRESDYPILLKASAGGGGRGMRVVRSATEMRSSLVSAGAEAKAAFGDATLYIERFVERARHIEIQVMGDTHGNVVHYGDRDCSIQRRHQKLIEEAPSLIAGSPLQEKMLAAAVRLASHVGYVGAGTVEFLLDLDTQEYYFLEMNTRIQVEHPVTEMITGLDLVAEMIRVASGAPISVLQTEVAPHGHAIECRINAEAPDQGFMPSPGLLERWKLPSGAGVRIDSHCYEGYSVPACYDSMLAKLITHGPDRPTAIALMKRALKAFEIAGIQTTIPFHKKVMAHGDFIDNCLTTQWVEQNLLANDGEHQ